MLLSLSGRQSCLAGGDGHRYRNLDQYGLYIEIKGCDLRWFPAVIVTSHGGLIGCDY
jgi:hypothetical protein